MEGHFAQIPRYDLFLDLRGHQCRASIRIGATSAAIQAPTMTTATNMVTSLYAECGQPFQMTVVTRPQHKFARRLFALTWGFECNRDVTANITRHHLIPQNCNPLHN